MGPVFKVFAKWVLLVAMGLVALFAIIHAARHAMAGARPVPATLAEAAAGPPATADQGAPVPPTTFSGGIREEFKVRVNGYSQTIAIWQDPTTACHYILMNVNGGYVVTPRLLRNGAPYCPSGL